jgi:hypothetical protein
MGRAAGEDHLRSFRSGQQAYEYGRRDPGEVGQGLPVEAGAASRQAEP